jgi:hypothetical protein
MGLDGTEVLLPLTLNDVVTPYGRIPEPDFAISMLTDKHIVIPKIDDSPTRTVEILKSGHGIFFYAAIVMGARKPRGRVSGRLASQSSDPKFQKEIEFLGDEISKGVLSPQLRDEMIGLPDHLASADTARGHECRYRHGPISSSRLQPVSFRASRSRFAVHG